MWNLVPFFFHFNTCKQLRCAAKFEFSQFLRSSACPKCQRAKCMSANLQQESVPLQWEANYSNRLISIIIYLRKCIRDGGSSVCYSQPQPHIQLFKCVCMGETSIICCTAKLKANKVILVLQYVTVIKMLHCAAVGWVLMCSSALALHLQKFLLGCTHIHANICNANLHIELMQYVEVEYIQVDMFVVQKYRRNGFLSNNLAQQLFESRICNCSLRDEFMKPLGRAHCVATENSSKLGSKLLFRCFIILLAFLYVKKGFVCIY